VKIVYAHQPLPTEQHKAIFLAGPTPRSSDVPSWRPEAIRELERLGYDGHVFVPEAEDGVWKKDYDGQVEWEEAALNQADIILFWISRDMKDMPALTTNDEFGFWKGRDPSKVVLACPDKAVKTTYQKYYAKKYFIPTFSNLGEACHHIVTALGEGAERRGGECQVPIHIWHTSSFQGWLGAQKAAGNRLDGARVEWAHRVANGRFLFGWALKVNVFVASENRNKTNEFVLSRTDISTICAYYVPPPPSCDVCHGRGLRDFYDGSAETCNVCSGKGTLSLHPGDVWVVVVREFRSPSTSSDGFVWELPGGSSHKPDKDPLQTAAEELKEELGILVDPCRFKAITNRQLAGTFSAHQAHLFAVELTFAEVNKLIRDDCANVTHGVATDTEITYTRVRRLHEVMEKRLVDWSTLGMLFQTLYDRDFGSKR
jgi:8-oxo-dGTP pyrophosphatase MutT (NUDIX family)